MTQKEFDDFLAVVAEIRERNCAIPEEIFRLLEKHSAVAREPNGQAERVARQGR